MSMILAFKGGAELERTLLQLSDKVAKKVARAAMRKAGKLVLDAARRNVPVSEGRLKRALRLRVDTLRNNRSVMSAAIDLKFNNDYRPRKTERKTMMRGRGKDRKLSNPGYSYQIGSDPKIYGAFVEFGTDDTAPRPFLRPAWDQVGGMTSLELIGKELWAGIEREANNAKFPRVNVTGRNY